MIFSDGSELTEETKIFRADFPVLEIAEEKLKSRFAVTMINVSHQTAVVNAVAETAVLIDNDLFFLRNDFVAERTQHAVSQNILQEVIDGKESSVFSFSAQIEISADDGKIAVIVRFGG